MVEFGQVIIGPPGSGKTTYCMAMKEFTNVLKRNCITINFDFGNDWNNKIEFNDYTNNETSIFIPDIDVRTLVNLQDIMDKYELGPNGGLLYCQKVLAKNITWVYDQINKIKKKKNIKNAYYLIDCPGQVELYTLDNSLQYILTTLNDKDNGIILTVVHLVDFLLVKRPHEYMSALLLSLSAQLNIEFPFINLLTKVDLYEEDELNFDLEYFLNANDIEYLIADANKFDGNCNEICTEKRKKIAEYEQAIAELIEDYSLILYSSVSVKNKDLLINVLEKIDKSQNYYFDS